MSAAIQVQPVPKARPALFNGAMVRALLREKDPKTLTRRIIKPQPRHRVIQSSEDGEWYDADCIEPGRLIRSPYGAPGDRLWVREAFSGDWVLRELPPSKWPADALLHYWADGNPGHGDWTPPKPSIHMPRWASRITLEIVSVRVERVQDISEEDARAEGVGEPVVHGRFALFAAPGVPHVNVYGDIDTDVPAYRTARDAFRALWTSIYGAESWERDWVWVYEFRRVGS